MEFKSNIDKNIIWGKDNLLRNDYVKVHILFKIAKIKDRLKKHDKNRKIYEKIIEICNKYPKNENMLIFKIKSLKKLNRTYRSLECIENLLEINPYNRPALLMIADICEGE